MLLVPETVVLGVLLVGVVGSLTILRLMAGTEHCVAGIISSSSLSEEELLAVLSEARAFLGLPAAWVRAEAAAGPAGLRLGSTKIRGSLITWLAGNSSLLSEDSFGLFFWVTEAGLFLLEVLELSSFWMAFPVASSSLSDSSLLLSESSWCLPP